MSELNKREKVSNPLENGFDKKEETVSSFLAGYASGVAPTDPIGAMVPLVASFFLVLKKKYRSLPVSNKIEAVNAVSETWKNRPKANIVKWLLQRSNTSLETAAEYLGCSVHYLNNKLTRDSFSFDDLLLVSYACGYTFVLMNNNEEAEITDSHRIDLLDFFENSDKDALERISRIEEEKQKEKRKEYEKKKAELERMKAEFGFED